jgi:4'-phosphopantetheinyl transferase
VIAKTKIAYVFVNENELHADYQYMYINLNDTENDYISKFYKVDDRNRTLIGTILIKQIYEHEHPNINNIELIRKGKTKPFLLINSNKKETKFNITHSKNIIMVATSDSEIGIDVEEIDQNRWIKTRKNQTFLENPLTNFFLNWVMIESYGKKKGKGLLEDNLFNAKFTRVNNNLFTFDKNYFHIFYPEKDYIACVCNNEYKKPKITKISYKSIFERGRKK